MYIVLIAYELITIADTSGMIGQKESGSNYLGNWFLTKQVLGWFPLDLGLCSRR